MRRGRIFVSGKQAGVLTEDEKGYHFSYDESYLSNPSSLPVSLTLPLQKEAFHSNLLFPFFDGLIPEGWLLNVAERNWKVRRHDRMGLLLACCRDCIGNVSVEPIPNEEEINR